jgi:predicted nucleic acid-binding protein
MKNKAFNVAAHAFTPADKVLPDANIWLFLYSPASAAYPSWLKARVRPYNRAWGNLLASKAKVFIDPIVLAEVINRMLDDEWKLIDPPGYGRKYAKRKDFRLSADYPPAAQSVQAIATQIMSDAQALDHPFSKWNVGKMLADFGSGSTDWNDQLITENCLHHNLKLMTDDGDHITGGLEVLTANGKLLAACPP